MRFADDALTCDGFLDGRIRLLQPRRGYRAATDPVFLAAFVPASPGDSVLEIGCGAGTAALCLAARVPGLDLHGLEVQPAYADLARRNAHLNQLPLTVHEGSLLAMPPELKTRMVDHVLMNPPFHPREATPSPDPGRAVAHQEDVPLPDWIDAGLRRLKPGGTLSIIHLAGRLGTIFCALEGRAGGAEILPVAPREGRPAGRVLVRARKGSRAMTVLHPPLVVHAAPSHRGDAEDLSNAAASILRDASGFLLNSPYGCTNS